MGQPPSKDEVGVGFEIEGGVVLGFEGGVDMGKVGELYKDCLTNIQNAMDALLHALPDSAPRDPDDTDSEHK